MLCATSPGECVGTPNSSQVCLVCSLDFILGRPERPHTDKQLSEEYKLSRSLSETTLNLL